jgi:sRNA-binding carbon storage regulator CsrA
MSYLVLSRKAGESVVLTASPDATDEEIVQALRAGVYVDLVAVHEGSVKIGFEAPKTIYIERQ